MSQRYVLDVPYWQGRGRGRGIPCRGLGGYDAAAASGSGSRARLWYVRGPEGIIIERRLHESPLAGPLAN